MRPFFAPDGLFGARKGVSMAESSNIAWCDDTWNFWRGCSKVSPGCVFCYAEELVTRRLGGEWGKGAPRVQSKSTLRDPFKWNKKPWICDACGRTALCDKFGQRTTGMCECRGMTTFHRRRVFSLSLGDWLDPEVPVAWLAQMLDTIRQCKNLDFLLLTKRIELFGSRLNEASQAVCDQPEGEFFESDGDSELVQWLELWLAGESPKNVWLGVSVEDQKRADERIPLLIATPARIRFLSVEPLLEHVDLHLDRILVPDIATVFGGAEASPGIDWVIVGGESGTQRRDCGVQAIESAVTQCVHAGVACFVKQDSHRFPGQQGRIPDHIFKIKQFPT